MNEELELSMKVEMKDLYTQRARLISALSKVFPSHWYWDPEEKGWPVVSILLPTKQVTWHIDPKDMDKHFSHVKEGEANWDRHGTKAKHDRLEALTKSSIDIVRYLLGKLPTDATRLGVVMSCMCLFCGEFKEEACTCMRDE